MPLQRKQNTAARGADVDLLDGLEKRPGRDLQGLRDRAGRRCRLEDGLAVDDRLAAPREQVVERAAERLAIAVDVDEVRRDAVHRVDRRGAICRPDPAQLGQFCPKRHRQPRRRVGVGRHYARAQQLLAGPQPQARKVPRV